MLECYSPLATISWHSGLGRDSRLSVGRVTIADDLLPNKWYGGGTWEQYAIAGLRACIARVGALQFADFSAMGCSQRDNCRRCC